MIVLKKNPAPMWLLPVTTTNKLKITYPAPRGYLSAAGTGYL